MERAKDAYRREVGVNPTCTGRRCPLAAGKYHPPVRFADALHEGQPARCVAVGTRLCREAMAPPLASRVADQGFGRLRTYHLRVVHQPRCRRGNHPAEEAPLLFPPQHHLQDGPRIFSSSPYHPPNYVSLPIRRNSRSCEFLPFRVTGVNQPCRSHRQAVSRRRAVRRSAPSPRAALRAAQVQCSAVRSFPR